MIDQSTSLNPQLNIARAFILEFSRIEFSNDRTPTVMARAVQSAVVPTVSIAESVRRFQSKITIW